MSKPLQSKKQASISHFFSAKPSAASKSDSPTAKAAPIAAVVPRPSDEKLFVEQDEVEEDRDEVPSRPGRRNISKRSWTFEEEPTSDNQGPAEKRRKTASPAERNLTPERNALTELRSPGKATNVPPLNAQGSKITDRTSKFLFGSPSSSKENDISEDEDTSVVKQRLHQRFVKKLGKPDSISEIKRRNGFLEDNVPNGEEVVEEDDVDEELPPSRTAKGKSPAVKKSSNKLTPMEKQVIDIKRKHMDAIVVVEVGYKFRFFGEDARVAAKELSIVCIPGKMRFDEHPSEAHLDRFASASIPTHRLYVHVKRLVQAGHKVGVVRQLETAALKAAGDNRNAPFVRKLTNLYTKGTYIDDIEGLDAPIAAPKGGAPATGHLLCITETNAKMWSTDEKVHVGFIAVQPGTGDIIYDDFEDGFMRGEIETRLLHIAPCEFLIVGELSKATERLVHHLSGSKMNVFGDKARVERVEKPKTAAANAYSHIHSFYSEKLKDSQSDDNSTSAKLLDKAHKLSESVSICLSAMIKHLSDYGLEHVFDLTKNFQSFSARAHMLLNGNTLNSLEIYRNQTDNSEKGSLFWVLDQTQTRFGQRMLRKWVGRPLLDKSQLQRRIDAVEELKDGNGSITVEKLRNILVKTKGDLEKSLIRIYYGKCTRPELVQVLQSLQRISMEYAHIKSAKDTGLRSEMVNAAVTSLPGILHDVNAFLERINAEAAKDDDKYAFFRAEHQTDAIVEHKSGIAAVEQQLDDHRAEAAEKLRKKHVDYVTVAGIEFLIEVENTAIKNVPASWAKISGTKKMSRFHTPQVIAMIRERDQHRESLAAACDLAFTELLSEISTNYQSFRDCIQSLATLDCLLSLSSVAARPGYTKPNFSDQTELTVTAGRHPMVEQLLLSTYVPNDIGLSSDTTRALLITGPNMGGKSSYVRQVALLAIMAQIGSYVPAETATFGLLDAVFTRMGAFDNMLAGESTFMVELSETADILKQASPRSLVLLDELGRGTSTHDGVAIAHAVLDYVVREAQCLTLFITHYQSLASVAEGFEDGALRNVHMKFAESARGPVSDEGEADSGEKDVTFLYEGGDGVAHWCYGLNVAGVANVPWAVLLVAGVYCRELEGLVRRAKGDAVVRDVGRLMRGEADEVEALVAAMDEL